MRLQVPLLTRLFGLQPGPTTAQIQMHTYSLWLTSKNSEGTCQTEEERESLRNGIDHDVSRRLTVFDRSCGGTDGWPLLTHFDMGNASHQCPGDYREVMQSGIRLSTRDCNSIGYNGQPWKECTSAVLRMLTNGTSYSAVCGRLIGYGY